MARFNRMVSMALTPKEVNEKVDQAMPASPSMTAIAENVPMYPYGLCISLEDEQLEKMELDINDCEVGDTVDLVCKAKVTSVSSREKMGGTCDRVELQITDIACEEEGEEAAEAGRANKMKSRYGKEVSA